MIRVLRLIEYTYASEEHMVRDIANWKVQGTVSPHHFLTIRSTTLPPSILEEDTLLQEMTKPAEQGNFTK